MDKKADRAVISLRILAVIIALAGLAFTGITAVEDMISSAQEPVKSLAETNPSDEAPEEPAEKMATNGNAGSPETACLLAPVVLKTENHSSRLKTRPPQMILIPAKLSVL